MQIHTAGDARPYNAGRHEKSSIDSISLSDLEDRDVLAVVRAWQKWRGFHQLPLREALQPSDLGRFAVNVSLVRVLGDGEDYEFRIIGDAHVQAFGANFTGMRVSHVIAEEPKFGRLLKASYDMVHATGRPYAFRGVVGYDASYARFSRFETCYLPFGAGAYAVDHIMNAASYTRPL